MSSRPTPPLALVALLAGGWLSSGLVACEEDVIVQPRPDSGVQRPDAGAFGPLPLQPGMTFTYLGQCSRRGSGGAEINSRYTLTLTIRTVDDQGPGASSLDFAATGQNETGRDWDQTADFDPWVSRLGPAKTIDRVGDAVVTADLSAAPTIPPAPVPPAGKTLPASGTFFLDLRETSALRAAFAEEYAGRQPQVVDPSRDVNGRWVFSLQGADPSIFYYETKTRRVRLEYDARGFLFRLDETIGDTSRPPSASCILTLTVGP
jgi:hypothetical protein